MPVMVRLRESQEWESWVHIVLLLEVIGHSDDTDDETSDGETGAQPDMVRSM